MELTISTLVKIFAGILALGIGIIVTLYFNGGIQHNKELLLGVIKIVLPFG
ncbi:MAG TPA: hypothetical protein HA230_01000 [Candidatus Aenigmarchaeota archaeon]|nr:hypothetical protein [Candidatus Aenigmarchaeota archaeon]